MKIIEDKAIIHVAKFSVMVVLILLAFGILPTLATTLRDGNYLKNEVVSYEKNNFDLYLNKVASYYSFYYEEEPLLENYRDSLDGSSFELSAYAVSYYLENMKDDVMQFFIKNMQYKYEQFTEIKVNLIYEDPIYLDSNSSDNDVYNLNIATIKNTSNVKSFWAGDAKNKESSTELNTLRAVELFVKTDSYDFVDYLIITDDETLKNEFIFSIGITENNLLHENYNISKNISDDITNLPTESEVLEFGLYYEMFDDSLLKPYNYVYILTYGIYGLITVGIFYLLFINGPLIKSIREKRKLNK